MSALGTILSDDTHIRRQRPVNSVGLTWGMAAGPAFPRSLNVLLLLINKVTTAILLPASFVALGAERFLLAVAERLDAAGADTLRSQRVPDRGSALVSQSEVILGGTTFVAVSLDRYVHVGMLAQELRIGLDRTLLITADISLIVVKVDILDTLSEQSLIGQRSSLGLLWRRLRDTDASRRILRASRTLCGQVIGGRIGRGNLL